jgi:hypothetical protein
MVFGSPHDLWWIVVKTVLLYATAVACFRVGERRTLAEMSAFDFVAAVAAGAIVGRVPNAHDAGYLAGAATLVTVLLAHRLTARLRYRPLFARLIDHPPRLLIADGKVLDAELRRTCSAKLIPARWAEVSVCWGRVAVATGDAGCGRVLGGGARSCGPRCAAMGAGGCPAGQAEERR